jgi:epoxyqueuosine reductase QueG
MLCAAGSRSLDQALSSERHSNLEPDGRLTGFDPCADCDRCQRACPAKAFDPSKPYPASWSRTACEAKRAEIAARGLYCHNCYAMCPAGQVAGQDLLWMRESMSFSAFRSRCKDLSGVYQARRRAARRPRRLSTNTAMVAPAMAMEMACSSGVPIFAPIKMPCAVANQKAR